MHWVAGVPEGHLVVEVVAAWTAHRGVSGLPVGHLMEGRGDEELPVDETCSDAVELGRAHAVQYRLMLETKDRGSPRGASGDSHGDRLPRLAPPGGPGARGGAPYPSRVGNGGRPPRSSSSATGQGGGPGLSSAGLALVLGALRRLYPTVRHHPPPAWASNREPRRDDAGRLVLPRHHPGLGHYQNRCLLEYATAKGVTLVATSVGATTTAMRTRIESRRTNWAMAPPPEMWCLCIPPPLAGKREA